MREKKQIDIEQLLVWAYQRQKVGVAPAGPETLLDMPGRSSFLGAGYDRSGFRVMTRMADVHDDAISVLGAVEGLPNVVRGDVERCALSGLRPSMPGPLLELRPSLNVWRRPETLTARQLGLSKRNIAAASLVLAHCHTDTVHRARGRYARWHQALVGMAATLGAAALKEHVPLPPSAPSPESLWPDHPRDLDAAEAVWIAWRRNSLAHKIWIDRVREKGLV